MLSQTENVDHDSFHTSTSKQQVPIHQLRYLLKTKQKKTINLIPTQETFRFDYFLFDLRFLLVFITVNLRLVNCHVYFASQVQWKLTISTQMTNSCVTSSVPLAE